MVFTCYGWFARPEDFPTPPTTVRTRSVENLGPSHRHVHNLASNHLFLASFSSMEKPGNVNTWYAPYRCACVPCLAHHVPVMCVPKSLGPSFYWGARG